MSRVQQERYAHSLTRGTHDSTRKPTGTRHMPCITHNHQADTYTLILCVAGISRCERAAVRSAFPFPQDSTAHLTDGVTPSRSQVARSPLRNSAGTSKLPTASGTAAVATATVGSAPSSSPRGQTDNSAVVEQAAVVIQAAWRGYYARCADIRCATVRREIRTRRAERHIELLSSDVSMLRDRLAR